LLKLILQVFFIIQPGFCYQDQVFLYLVSSESRTGINFLMNPEPVANAQVPVNVSERVEPTLRNKKLLDKPNASRKDTSKSFVSMKNFIRKMLCLVGKHAELNALTVKLFLEGSNACLLCSDKHLPKKNIPIPPIPPPAPSPSSTGIPNARKKRSQARATAFFLKKKLDAESAFKVSEEPSGTCTSEHVVDADDTMEVLDNETPVLKEPNSVRARAEPDFLVSPEPSTKRLVIPAFKGGGGNPPASRTILKTIDEDALFQPHLTLASHTYPDSDGTDDADFDDDDFEDDDAYIDIYEDARGWKRSRKRGFSVGKYRR